MAYPIAIATSLNTSYDPSSFCLVSALGLDALLASIVYIVAKIFSIFDFPPSASYACIVVASVILFLDLLTIAYSLGRCRGRLEIDSVTNPIAG